MQPNEISASWRVRLRIHVEIAKGTYAKVEIEIEVKAAVKNETARSRQTHLQPTRGVSGCAAIHPLAHHPTRGPESTAEETVRRRPGNHAGACIARQRMHRPRTQPSQRTTDLHRGRCA